MTDTSRIDAVDEASEDSFPASDPPSFTGLHAGAPTHESDLEPAPPRDPERWLRRVALAQGALYLAGGLWPILHYRSYTALTGKKHDRWLVKANGAILASVGIALLRSAGTDPARGLGLTTALSIAAVEATYAARGKLAGADLADAAAELAIGGAWLAASLV